MARKNMPKSTPHARSVSAPSQEELADIFSWARLPICRGREYSWLVVREGSCVRGYAQYRLMRGHADTAIIDFLEARAYYRRRGYGRLLVAHLQHEYPRLVAYKVLRKARPFWRAMDFAPEYADAFWDDDWYWQRGGT